VGTCLDIHDQRETLHALSETQTRLTSVLNRAPVAIWSADQNGIVTHSDGHGLEAMGLKPGQLVGASLQNLYQNDAEVLTNLKRAYQGKAFSSEVKIKDAWFETHFFPLKDSGGSITGIGGVSTEITARKTVQEERLRLEVAEKSAIEIKESQQFLDSLIEHLPSMVFVKEAKDLKYVRFNRAGEILTGHSREELIGRSDADFFPKEQAEFFNAKDREVLNNRVILTVSEETILTKFNGQRILRTKKVPILDSQGNPKYLMGISEDITDIKRVQEERDRFFTTSLDMLAVSGMDGYFKQVNPVVQTILGYTSEEFCRIPYMELVHPDDAIPTAKEVARQMGGDSVLKFENRYRCKDGGYKWLSWKSTPVGDLMYACARDVTEEKKVREQIQILNQQLEIRVQKRTQELEATVNKLNRLISSNMVGIMFWNNEGHITEANNAFLGMLGYTREDLEANRINWKGMTPSEYTERDAAARAELNSVGVCTPFEKEYLHKNGHRVPILIGAALFEGDANTGLCFVLDRTETKKASEERDRMHLSEQAAIAASKMKSTFLANMSHEIRTPINGVMGMTSLLIDTNLTGEQRNYAETIRSSAETLLTLVNDILDLTKAESGKIDLELICFDVKQVMADIERTLAFSVRKKGLQILHSISPDLPAYLKGDPTRLGQVLLNLVSNAIKFTAEGAVTIELKQEFRKGEEVGLLFEITDTGIGIPTESLERMFLSFSQADSSTTRRYGGTGLGLSISKHLVTLMGGKIGVRSTPGKGSTFWFTLPMTVGPSTLGDIPRLDSPEPSSQQKLRILIAEDNSVNQLIALKMLERLGHTAVAVANGQEVIDALNAAPYDMVFMDCQMPELDGYEATRKIRATTTSAFHGIPIVAMTANAMAGDREKCLASGMSDYISKPMKSRDLHNAIERAFMKNIKKAA
jgi:PAS domain S-box-containing protein